MGFDIEINLKWFRGIPKPKKNLRWFLVTEHAKLGLVKNCLNSVIRWLANVTILLFTRTFETWFFCFSRKAKAYNTIPLFSENLRAMCFFFTAGNVWYKVKHLRNNGKRVIFFKKLIGISEFPCASVSKWVKVRNHYYDLHCLVSNREGLGTSL